MIPIKFILVVVVWIFVICCTNCQSDNPRVSSSWSKLQISPDTLSSMDFGNFHIEIYEHVDNHKATTIASQRKYFFSPLGLLEYNSAVSINNRFTKQPEMRFRLEMWNEKVQKDVVEHLNQIVGQEIKSNQVRIIPVEKVILTSNVPMKDYSLSPIWTNYYKSQSLWFYLSCRNQEVCDQLADGIRSNPTQFHHLKLLYSLSSQTSQTKQATISIDSVTSGQMVANLLQKFKDKKEIFLTANDETKMLKETSTTIRMDTFQDSEVESPETGIQLDNILKDLLITSKTIIKEESDKMWDSVFWNDDNYRPDKTTKTLNAITKKIDKETQKKLADLFLIQHNHDANRWADVDRISSAISEKLANDSDSSHKDVDKLLQESKNHVQWEGEKFVPKPVQLSKINLDKFRDSQLFQDRNVRVRYTNAELSASIKFVGHAELTATDEWNNLKDQLKEALMKLGETNNELSRVKKDLKGTREELEIMRTNVADLSTKLKATVRELAEMKIRDGNLQTEIKVVEDNLRKELRGISNNLESTTTNLSATRTELYDTKSVVADLTNELNARTSEIVDIGQMPTSCEDLERMGHKLSGFFSVKGSKKMEMIYCNFYPVKNDKQQWIGYVDVKSVPVHFYVQRNHSLTAAYSRIPFHLALVNEGNAMNLTFGMFTAPRPGIYFFSFTGLAHFPISPSNTTVQLSIGIYLNEDKIGVTLIDEGNTVENQNDQLTVQSTLNLKKGDRIWLATNYMDNGVVLGDGDFHSTHFTGFMLEEEIVASL